METQKKFKPFKWPWAVSRFHCIRCNTIREIDLDTVGSLLATMASLGSFPEVAISHNDDFKKYYFEIPYCDNCKKDEDREPESLKLKLVKPEHSK